MTAAGHPTPVPADQTAGGLEVHIPDTTRDRSQRPYPSGQMLSGTDHPWFLGPENTVRAGGGAIRVAGMSAKITRINPDQLHETPGYHHITVVEAGRTAYLAGQCPLDRRGSLVGSGSSTCRSTRSRQTL